MNRQVWTLHNSVAIYKSSSLSKWCILKAKQVEESGEDSPVAAVVVVTLVSLFLTLSVAAVIILVVWRWAPSNGKKILCIHS